MKLYGLNLRVEFSIIKYELYWIIHDVINDVFGRYFLLSKKLYSMLAFQSLYIMNINITSGLFFRGQNRLAKV